MIYGVEGIFGSGKSAYTSLAATDLAFSSGWSLAANYSLLGAVRVYTIAELYDLRCCVLVIDEGHGSVDSRNSSGKGNLEFWAWFSQCRKQQLVVFVISQEMDMVDKRIRAMCSVVTVCDRLDESYSQAVTWKMRKGKPESRLSSVEFDRRWSYGLYDHEERAWPLTPAAQGVASAAGGRGHALKVVSL